MRSKLSTLTNIQSGSVQTMSLALYRRAINSDFVRKVAETFITRVVLIGIGLITTVIIARILGPEGRGFYAVAAAIGAIGVQFGNFGLHASNTYYVAKNRELLPALVGNTLMVSFVLGGLGVTLAWIAFTLWPRLAPVHGLLLVLSLIWIPFGLAYMLLQNILLGINQVHAYNRIELISKILAVGLIAIVVVFRIVTVASVFSMSLIALVISLIWVLWSLQAYLNDRSMPSFALFKNNISYGLKAYISAFFAYLVLRMDLLMVQYMKGAEQAGYYSIAATMADMVNMLPVVIGTIIFPRLSAMPNNKEKWGFTKKVAIGTSLIMLAFVVLARLLARPAVRLLFTTAFLPAVPAFIWLLPGIFFIGIQVITVQFLNSVGLPKAVVVAWFFAFLLNIVLNLWAIPSYGIMGASVVSSLSYFIVFILILLIIQITDYKHE